MHHIDRALAAIADAIHRLREYRSALVTAAVTGQIDVRNPKAKEVVSCQ
jgi:hypothetical protein